MTSPWSTNTTGAPLTTTSGFYANVRADYCSMLADDKYPQAPWSYNRNGLAVIGVVDTTQPYTTTPTPLLQPFHRGNIANTVSNTGYNNCYSPYTSKGTFEPLLSNTIPQCSMRNGVILPAPVPVRKRTFLMPVLSAVVGVLIPPDQYKLIPLKALMNLLLEVTLSPYGMFSTGYQDRYEWDAAGMTRPIPRAFRITKFQWILNIYNFPS